MTLHLEMSLPAPLRRCRVDVVWRQNKGREILNFVRLIKRDVDGRMMKRRRRRRRRMMKRRRMMRRRRVMEISGRVRRCNILGERDRKL